MNLGRVVPLHRGDYDAAQTYELNDIVNYQGAGYWHRGKTATTGVAPTDGTVWVRIINGVPGPTGDPATLVDNDVAYQVGDSGTVLPTGEWSGDVPNVAQGKYLWVRTTITFSSGEPVVCYGVSRMGVDGRGSVISVNGISPDDNGDVKFPGAKGKYLGFTEENELGAVDLPSASTTDKGITYLVDSYTSTDTGKAATPKAVNEVYKRLPVSTSVTLTAAGWSSGTQTVSVTGVTAENHVIVAPAPASRDTYINSDVRCTAQGAGTLTFTAASTPTVDVTVNVIILKQ
nr:MAG TPA: Minor structural protein [Caudoviricetes sp.]